MGETFNPETQYLVFKQSIIDGAPIYIYQGWQYPSYTVIPSETDYDTMLSYWEKGFTYLFDVINK